MSQFSAIAKIFADAARQDKQDNQQDIRVLPEEMALTIAREVLKAMPEDADVLYFTGKAIAQIAMTIDKESENIALKTPTAQELIAYTGTFPVNDSDMTGDALGQAVKKATASMLRGCGATDSIEKAEREKWEKDTIKKLANSRYDLSEFADITYADEKKAKQIVIAAAYKGKFLHVTIKSSNANFLKILKKCTLH